MHTDVHSIRHDNSATAPRYYLGVGVTADTLEITSTASYFSIARNVVILLSLALRLLRSRDRAFAVAPAVAPDVLPEFVVALAVSNTVRPIVSYSNCARPRSGDGGNDRTCNRGVDIPVDEQRR